MSDHRVFVHDMKNLLGIILGFTSLLLDETPAGDQRRADLDEIRKAGEGALALVETLDPAAREERRT